MLKLSATDRLILHAVREAASILSLTDLAIATGASPLTVHRRCQKLAAAGVIARHRSGAAVLYGPAAQPSA